MKHHSVPLRSLCISAVLFSAKLAFTQTFLPDFPVTNSSIQAMLYVPETDEILIGGGFKRIGPFTGSFAGVDRTTAAWNTPSLHKPNGPVTCAASDGVGGWYLGGYFTAVGTAPRHYLAHILANGTVDPDWIVATDGPVTSLIINGPSLYLAGEFTTVGGQPRALLAAVDLGTGIPTSFNPGASGGPDAKINSIVADSLNLYIGGSDLTTVGGSPRNNLASVNLTTGLTTAWNPAPVGSVETLVIDGGDVLVGGTFTSIGGSPRTNLAAINISNGLASAFAPNPGNTVHALAVSGSSVFVGGYFSAIGAEPSPLVAQINANTGARIAWDVLPDGAPSVLIPTATALFLGGDFQTLGGVSRRGLASINATTGAISAFDPDIVGSVNALARSGNTIFAGGTFATAGGQPRQNLAAYDLGGPLLPFVANVNHAVRSLEIQGPFLLIGGTFLSVNGTPRSNLAEVVIATGALTPWAPTVDGAVNTILSFGDDTFVGGQFNNIGAQPRSRLGAVSRATGLATAWQADADGDVYALGLRGDTLYVAGRFDTLDGQARGTLAAVNATTANLLPWSPSTDGTSNTILIGEQTAFVGGEWENFNGTPSAGLREVGLIQGANPPFVGPFVGSILALATSPTRLFVGGNLRGIGDGRRNFAAFAHPATPDTPGLSPSRPTLSAKGKTKLKTSRRRVVLRGTATDATRVEFKSGKGGFRPAKGSASKWKVPVRPTAKRTIVKVRATGPGGRSLLLKIKILRKE